MLGKNIIFLRKQKGWTQAELAEKLNVARTTLGDYERGRTEPSLDMLSLMAHLFEVTMDSMVKERIYSVQYSERFPHHYSNGFRGAMQPVELVESKAEAGYLESFQDPEFITELPKIYIPNLPKNEYRGFEIEGESMLPMEPGSIVIGTRIESLDLIKDHRTYVIITKRDGLVYKRIQKLSDENKLLATSDNPVFPAYEIAFDDIDEVWQYYAHLSFSDNPVRYETIQQDQLDEIQKKIDALYDKLC